MQRGRSCTSSFNREIWSIDFLFSQHSYFRRIYWSWYIFISLNKFAQADCPEDKIHCSFRDQTFWFFVKLIFYHHFSGSRIFGAEFKFWSNNELWSKICWPRSFHGHCIFWSLIIWQRDAANLVREFAQSRIWSFCQSGAMHSHAILWLLIVSIEDTQLQLTKLVCSFTETVEQRYLSSDVWKSPKTAEIF